MSFRASTTGAQLLGGLSGANYRGQAGMGNAYLRAKGRMMQAKTGADSIESQSRIAADQINRNATRNMFGSIIGGIGSGIVSGLGNMNSGGGGGGGGGVDGFSIGDAEAMGMPSGQANYRARGGTTEWTTDMPMNSWRPYQPSAFTYY